MKEVTKLLSLSKTIAIATNVDINKAVGCPHSHDRKPCHYLVLLVSMGRAGQSQE